MKAHKYWSIGALAAMIAACYTGYKGRMARHKYFALGSLVCMVMAMYTGHKMISGHRNAKGAHFRGDRSPSGDESVAAEGKAERTAAED